MKKILLFIFIVLISDSAVSQWSPTAGPGTRVHYINSFGSNIYVTSDSGRVFYSSNNGDSWNAIPIPGENQPVWSIIFTSKYIFVNTSHHAYRSSNNGTSWEGVGLYGHHPYLNSYGPMYCVNDTVFIGQNAYLDDDPILFLSTDFGSSWGIAMNNSYGAGITCMANVGNTLYVGTNNGLYSSSYGSLNWIPVKDDSNRTTGSLFCNDSLILFSGSNDSSFFRSTNKGKDWDVVKVPFHLYAIMITSFLDSTLLLSIPLGNSSFYVSFDYGVNWYDASKGLPAGVRGGVLITNEFMFVGFSNFVWRIPRKSFSKVISSQSHSGNIVSFWHSSSAVSSDAYFQFEIIQPSEISIYIYDLRGILVKKIGNRVSKPGKNSLLVGINDLSKGVFFAVISDGVSSQVISFINEK